MGYFTKRYHPPGTMPGTLTAAEPALEQQPPRLHLLGYVDILLSLKEREDVNSNGFCGGRRCGCALSGHKIFQMYFKAASAAVSEI